jgi:hypothetical protein
VHISSYYFDLEPVLRKHAEATGLSAVLVINPDGPYGVYGSEWILLSRNRDFLNAPYVRETAVAWRSPSGPGPPWTDDFANVLAVVKR